MKYKSENVKGQQKLLRGMTAIVLECRECCDGKCTREAVCIDCYEITYTCIAKDTPLLIGPCMAKE